jgi:uncharacterized Zn-binding protein involved in type VI secretion
MFDMAVGTCVGHKTPIPAVGYIMAVCPTVLVNSMPIARQMDIVITACGHIGYIVQGSPTVLAKSIPVARMGDMVTGVFSGYIVQGSSNVLCK